MITPELCQAFTNYKEIWQTRQQTYPRQTPYQPSVMGENIAGSCLWVQKQQQKRREHPELINSTPNSIATGSNECRWIIDLKNEFDRVEDLHPNAELQAVFDRCTDNNPPAQTP